MKRPWIIWTVVGTAVLAVLIVATLIIISTTEKNRLANDAADRSAMELLRIKAEEQAAARKALQVAERRRQEAAEAEKETIRRNEEDRIAREKAAAAKLAADNQSIVEQSFRLLRLDAVDPENLLNKSLWEACRTDMTDLHRICPDESIEHLANTIVATRDALQAKPYQHEQRTYAAVRRDLASVARSISSSEHRIRRIAEMAQSLEDGISVVLGSSDTDPFMKAWSRKLQEMKEAEVAARNVARMRANGTYPFSSDNRLALGSIGCIPSGSEVFQVLGNNSILVNMGGTIVKVDNISTTNVVTGTPLELSQSFVVTSQYTYPTVDGGSNTVFVLMPKR